MSIKKKVQGFLTRVALRRPTGMLRGILLMFLASYSLSSMAQSSVPRCGGKRSHHQEACAVPATSGLGNTALAGLLGAFGLFLLQRRRKQNAN